MTVTDVLDELGVPYARGGEHRHVMVNFVGIDCPLCSPKTGKMKLGIRVGTSWASCWSCGPQNLIGVLADVSGTSYGRVRRLIEVATGKTPLPAPERPLNAKLELPKGLGPLLPAHESYLERRGFDPRTCVDLWGVGGIGRAAKLAWRLFLPVRDAKGKTISWTTRAVSDAVEPRYVAAKPEQESAPIKSVLAGIEHVRHAAVAVEGYLDMMAGGPGFVATLGVGYSRAQVLALAKIPVRTILFDAEPEAQRRAAELCEELACFDGATRRVELQTGKDPADANRTAKGRRELELIRKHFL